MEYNQPRKTSLPSEQLMKGKSPEEKDKFRRSYMRAKTVLNELNLVAHRELARKNADGDSPTSFNTENWAYLQAWYAGYRQAMRLMAQLTRTK